MRAMVYDTGGPGFVLLYGVSVEHLDEGVAHVTRLLEGPGLVGLPTVRFPLEDLEQAHAAARDGLPAKVLVDVAQG